VEIISTTQFSISSFVIVWCLSLLLICDKSAG